MKKTHCNLGWPLNTAGNVPYKMAHHRSVELSKQIESWWYGTGLQTIGTKCVEVQALRTKFHVYATLIFKERYISDSTIKSMARNIERKWVHNAF